MSKLTVGIDYSMTSPSMCILDKKGKIDHIVFYAQRQRELKNPPKLPFRYTMLPYPEYDCEEQRHYTLAQGFASIIKTIEPEAIGIENYAFSARGQVFDLAEATGCLKNMLWQAGYSLEKLEPTVVKKLGAGAGNADKSQMYDAWLKETGIDLLTPFGLKKNGNKVPSPVSDIVDAYFVARITQEKQASNS